MVQYSHFRRTGTNLKTAGVSPQVAWYGIATMCLVGVCRMFRQKNLLKREQIYSSSTGYSAFSL